MTLETTRSLVTNSVEQNKRVSWAGGDFEFLKRSRELCQSCFRFQQFKKILQMFAWSVNMVIIHYLANYRFQSSLSFIQKFSNKQNRFALYDFELFSSETKDMDDLKRLVKMNY